MKSQSTLVRRANLLVVPLIALTMACTGDSLPTAPDSPAAVSSAIDGPVLHETAPVPMKITALVILGAPEPPPAGCLVFSLSTIPGNATHLGRFEGEGSTCISDITAPDATPPFVPPGPAPYATGVFNNPSWVLTAANGDELWLVGEGVAVFSLVTGALVAQGIHTIVGGTGRFAGASGELESSAINADGQGGDDFESSGWILFDASSRADH